MATLPLVDTNIFSNRFYKSARPDIRDAMLTLLDLPGLILPRKRRYHQVFAYYVTYGSLSFADAFHATLVRETMAELVSFDQGLDRVPGLRRIEP